MEYEEKAEDYIARLKIELSKIVPIMMEAERDGFDVRFSIGLPPEHVVEVSLVKTWK